VPVSPRRPAWVWPAPHWQPGLTQLNPQSAISQLEALGYNVQVNVGTVYVDANCPEGDDYFRSTDSLRIASSSVSSRLQKAKRTR
jgi:hypothetical protein